MKKFITIASILAISFLVVACGNGTNNEPPVVTNDPTVHTQAPVAQPHPGLLPPQNLDPVQVTEPPAEPIPDMIPPSGYYFVLTPEERAIYERFLVELDTSLFYGLSPISVARLYIQAGVDGEWEAEFYMHNQASMEITKEQFHENHLIDMQWSVLESRQSLANWVFPFLDDAYLHYFNDDWVLLVFDSVPDPEIPLDEQDTLHVMNLYRNTAGIWEMRFRPHVLELPEE